MADTYAYDPFGVNHLKNVDRQPLVQAYQGDALSLMFPDVMYSGKPATPESCVIRFTLKNDRFDPNKPESAPIGKPPPPPPTPPPPWVLPWLWVKPFDYYEGPFPSGLIWNGNWRNGVETTSTPGLIQVTLPQWVMNLLRRGAYTYDLAVAASPLGDNRQTLAEGTIQIEYGTNAPNPSVPYHGKEYMYILGRLS